jgi:hypothetical protein
MEEQKAALKRKQRKVEKEAVAQGKKPYYPKKCMWGGLLRWGCLGATLIFGFLLFFFLGLPQEMYLGGLLRWGCLGATLIFGFLSWVWIRLGASAWWDVTEDGGLVLWGCFCATLLLTDIRLNNHIVVLETLIWYKNP